MAGGWTSNEVSMDVDDDDNDDEVMDITWNLSFSGVSLLQAYISAISSAGTDRLQNPLVLTGPIIREVVLKIWSILYISGTFLMTSSLD